ncbi:MAG: hypothetical protein RL618_1151 [Pseudomonadota bacterium]|jgi:hypothetical protein
MNTSVTRLFLVLMLASGWTWAQTASSDGVRESTDPSRAADVERKAQTMSGQSGSETGASGQEIKSQEKAKKSKKLKKRSRQQGTKGGTGTSS